MRVSLLGIVLKGIGVMLTFASQLLLARILGLNQAGWIMLAVSILTCGLGGMVMGVIGFVEGIIYLSKSDQEFYEQYTLGKRQWF